ncbi:hypothetical protein AVEN_136376-1 [Araneus ventricosus]|uniref:Uncharacterized protein n=1 Tax=Araneus ventricosus TaxID=182803 RepID=A0A4Y2Q3C9_ARAVE|nr:hypothetical protein AVEN_136376-1 [Araneus ventricosus]
MKSTRTRAKNDVIGFRRSEPIILSDFLPQLYQGRVYKYAPRSDGEDYTSIGTASPNFRTSSARERFTGKVRFSVHKAPNTADLQWNRFSNPDLDVPEADTLKLDQLPPYKYEWNS